MFTIGQIMDKCNLIRRTELDYEDTIVEYYKCIDRKAVEHLIYHYISCDSIGSIDLRCGSVYILKFTFGNTINDLDVYTIE